ncbi:TadA family conjugal transfer-associated ATPase [Arthrobacter crystallopoietes]|jgi:pilus assembly protein CpaF|uniref:Pilus assembly protein CpaF n=1 Tax=Crystallibacter crystallopoietes TaxID=37928 RepID=A0A1H1EJE9_9MICC|nr:TadA family conjugal transfer-associated ATPase [Arthrobacter crystallopoietes]AUI49883.1 secretion system protein E [Arthrobacter crystallopoietes]SDQ88857.1 pilus assembly protein CpaF [Arthrobacter crystallopoietes]
MAVPAGSRGRRAATGPVGSPVNLAPFRDAVLSDPSPVTGARVAAAVQSSGQLLGTDGVLEAVENLTADLRGLGPLQRLALKGTVTDILVNGPSEVWTDGERGLERSQVTFSNDAEVRALATRLVTAGGRRLDDGNPCVDVRLDGYRVHAVLPPVSTQGTLLSIRIRRPRVFTLAELVGPASGWLPYLEAVVAGRLNFLISGATGSGKTTMLSAMLGLSASFERLVLVEDAAELNPDHPHVVGLQSRHSNLEGSGSVDLGELVRQALRMRPDRLIVGECRGAEVREFLAAMNTGHAGAGGTVHANSAAGVPARLAAMGALAGLEPQALALQASTALDVIIHLDRTAAGRQIRELALLRATSAGTLETVPALVARGTTMEFGPGWRELEPRLFGAGTGQARTAGS